MNNKSTNNVLKQVEEQEKGYYKLITQPGECVGEWEVINNFNKFLFALEDTHLFYLDKEHFMDYLYKPILKSDYERQNFLRTQIPPFRNLKNFDNLFRQIKSQVKKLYFIFSFSIKVVTFLLKIR